MKRLMSLLTIVLCLPLIGFAQDHQEEHGDHLAMTHEFLHHRLSAGFGYTYVPKGVDESTEEEGIFVPTLSVEYFYKFSHKWSAGLMVDFELSQYVIPFLDDFVERHNTLIIGAVGLYEPIVNWGIYAGGGIEIEKHHNFAVLKIGTDDEFQIGKKWDISRSLTFDYKEEYTSWSLMVSFGKHF
jgi:hypothetical protein